MYKKDLSIPASILIIKTSSLGDIIQAFDVVADLHARFPNAAIDWVVEERFQEPVHAHPLIRKTIAFQRRHLLQTWRHLREEKYDLVFDLQANCKSAVLTAITRANCKVGYGLKTVREWPNVLASHIRFNVSKKQNIRLFYLELIEKFFAKKSALVPSVRFKIDAPQKAKLDQIIEAHFFKIMVCPHSNWENKKLKPETLLLFLQKIETSREASFFFMWGNEEEKKLSLHFAKNVKRGVVVEKLNVPAWQNLMSEMDLMIAVDSGALHLCATTDTPSFSLFGPTSPAVFKPLGVQHTAVQGACPYGVSFDKQCPQIRSCKTGACMKELSVEVLFQAFENQCGSLRL